jgi:hypothetical protein
VQDPARVIVIEGDKTPSPKVAVKRPAPIAAGEKESPVKKPKSRKSKKSKSKKSKSKKSKEPALRARIYFSTEETLKMGNLWKNMNGNVTKASCEKLATEFDKPAISIINWFIRHKKDLSNSIDSSE